MLDLQTHTSNEYPNFEGNLHSTDPTGDSLQMTRLAERLFAAIDLLTKGSDQRYYKEVVEHYFQKLRRSQNLNDACAVVGEVERIAFHLALLQPPLEYVEREIPLAPDALRRLNTPCPHPAQNEVENPFTAHLSETLARVPLKPTTLPNNLQLQTNLLFPLLPLLQELSLSLTLPAQPACQRRSLDANPLENIRAQILSPKSIDHLRNTIKIAAQLKSRGQISPQQFSLLVAKYRQAVARLKAERSAHLAPLFFSLIDQNKLKEAAHFLTKESLQGNRQVAWALSQTFKEQRPALYTTLLQRWRAAACRPRSARFVRWAAYIDKNGVPNDPRATFHLLTKEDRLLVWKLAHKSHQDP